MLCPTCTAWWTFRSSGFWCLVLVCVWFLTFQRIVAPSSQWLSSQSFRGQLSETSGTTRPGTQRHIPEDLTLEQYCYMNLKSCIIVLLDLITVTILGTEYHYETPHYSVLSILLLMSVSSVHVLSSTPYSQTPLILYTPLHSRTSLISLKCGTSDQTVKNLIIPVEKRMQISWYLNTAHSLMIKLECVSVYEIAYRCWSGIGLFLCARTFSLFM